MIVGGAMKTRASSTIMLSEALPWGPIAEVDADDVHEADQRREDSIPDAASARVGASADRAPTRTFRLIRSSRSKRTYASSTRTRRRPADSQTLGPVRSAGRPEWQLGTDSSAFSCRGPRPRDGVCVHRPVLGTDPDHIRGNLAHEHAGRPGRTLPHTGASMASSRCRQTTYQLHGPRLRRARKSDAIPGEATGGRQPPS